MEALIAATAALDEAWDGLVKADMDCWAARDRKEPLIAAWERAAARYAGALRAVAAACQEWEEERQSDGRRGTEVPDFRGADERGV